MAGENEFCAYTDQITLENCPLPPSSGFLMSNLPLFGPGFSSFAGVCRYHRAELELSLRSQGVQLVELFGNDLQQAFDGVV